jgi:hypothetical protein
MENKKDADLFIWKITYSPVIAYFIAGMFAVLIMDYQKLFLSEALSFMHLLILK